MSSTTPVTKKAKTGNAIADCINKAHKGSSTYFTLKAPGNSKSAQAWNFFHEVTSIKDQSKVKNSYKHHPCHALACCNICGDLLGSKSYNDSKQKWLTTTANMKHHLDQKHNGWNTIQTGNGVGAGRLFGVSHNQRIDTILKQNAKKHGRQYNADEQKKYQLRQTSKWVCACNIPFSSVEQPEFRNMMLSYNKDFTPISRKALRDDIGKLHDEIRAVHIEDTKDQFVSTTLDHWTPKHSHDNYVGMTASWISKEWKKDTCTLGMLPHTGRSTAQDILSKFLSDLTSLLHNETKIVACTSDSTGNMNSFGILLKKYLIMHPYCTDHILQLTCKLLYDDKTYNDAGLNDLRDTTACVKQARKLVKHFNKSPQAMKNLKQAQTSFNKTSIHDDIGLDYIGVEEVREEQQEGFEAGASLESDAVEDTNNNNSNTAISTNNTGNDQVQDENMFPRRKVPLKLFQDIKTRWWSTFRMIRRLLDLKKELKYLQGLPTDHEHKVECEHYLTDDQWKQLEALVYVLSAFYKGMKMMEGEKYVTSSWVPVQINAIHRRLKSGTKHDLPLVQSLSEKMLKDFEKRWFRYDNRMFHSTVLRAEYNRQVGIHPCFIYAMCLDPRFKKLQPNMTGVQAGERDEIWDSMLALMIVEKMPDYKLEVAGIVSRFANNNNNNSAENFEEEEVVEEEVEETEESKGEEDDGSLCSMFVQDDDDDDDDGATNNIINDDEQRRYMNCRRLCELELDNYQKENSISLKKNGEWRNPLDWWKEKESQYPTLSILARKFLAIEGTSASSERIFSKGERIITRDRNRLLPEIVGKTLYVSSNLKFWETYMENSGYDEIIVEENEVDESDE